MTLAEHVVLRALALGLHSMEVLHVTLRGTFCSGRSALGLPSREVLYVTLAEHVLLRALALRLLKGRSYT